MTNSVKSGCLGLPLLMLALQYGLAQAPSGPVNFSFNSASTYVYDLSSTYDISQSIVASGGTLVPFTISGMPLTHYSSGRLAGSGLITATIGDEPAIPTFFTASGRVSGGGNGPTHVRFSVQLRGNDIVAGVQTGYTISVRYDLEVDPESLSLIGSARGRATFTKLPGATISSDSIVIPLPPGVDGTWSAQLDVVALSSLTGSGNVVLSNGRMLPVRLAGNFSNFTGLSRIHTWGVVSGYTDGRPTPLRMLFATDAVAPDSLNGTILGQKVVQ